MVRIRAILIKEYVGSSGISGANGTDMAVPPDVTLIVCVVFEYTVHENRLDGSRVFCEIDANSDSPMVDIHPNTRVRMDY